MTIAAMYKTCPRCKLRYSYNPSAGDFGFVCPHCGGLAVPFVGAAVKWLSEIFD